MELCLTDKLVLHLSSTKMGKFFSCLLAPRFLPPFFCLTQAAAACAGSSGGVPIRQVFKIELPQEFQLSCYSRCGLCWQCSAEYFSFSFRRGGDCQRNPSLMPCSITCYIKYISQCASQIKAGVVVKNVENSFVKNFVKKQYRYKREDGQHSDKFRFDLAFMRGHSSRNMGRS